MFFFVVRPSLFLWRALLSKRTVNVVRLVHGSVCLCLCHVPVFLHLRNTNLPGPSSIMSSEQAQQRRYDRKHNKTERAKKRRS